VAGLELLVGAVGTSIISEVQEINVNGELCYKVKVKMLISGQLKDRLITRHPSLGRVVIPLVYEKVQRACFFCGEVGHEMGQCMVRTRVARVTKEGRYNARPGMDAILELKIGAWIVNPHLLSK
jgi:hypothetical protein